jgi:hypothetical protein
MVAPASLSRRRCCMAHAYSTMALHLTIDGATSKTPTRDLSGTHCRSVGTMKGRHDSSTEGGMGRRVASTKALNLNNTLSCHLLSCCPTQCCPVPLSCRPSLCRPLPCRPLPLSYHPLLLLCPPLPCHPLPYHPPLHASLVLAGCCIASFVAPTSLARRMVVESPPLLPHRPLSHCTPASLIMPPPSCCSIPLSLRRASLVAPISCQ